MIICPYLVTIYRFTCNIERFPNVVFRPSHRPLSSTSVYHTFASNRNSDVKRSHLKFCTTYSMRVGGVVAESAISDTTRVTIMPFLVKIGFDSNATALFPVVLFTRHYSFKNLLDTTIAISLQFTTHSHPFSVRERATVSVPHHSSGRIHPLRPAFVAARACLELHMLGLQLAAHIGVLGVSLHLPVLRRGDEAGATNGAALLQLVARSGARGGLR
jgi:hypothetical protein